MSAFFRSLVNIDIGGRVDRGERKMIRNWRKWLKKLPPIVLAA
jgi:hypothetical protein